MFPVIMPVQGLVTNDVMPLAQPSAQPVYAAILTPKGRFLHDVFLHRGAGKLLYNITACSKLFLCLLA